jgi:hypothetical protein
MSETAVVMVSNRPEQLSRFLASLWVRYGDRFGVMIHLQSHDRSEVVVPLGLQSSIEWLVTEESVGCHAARVVALRHMDAIGWHPDAYVNVDDDVTLIQHTHWEPAIDKAVTEPGCGFVLTNWVRHPNAISKGVERMEDRFYRQIMVYNGGGMAYSSEVAALMRDLEPVPARYDDIWPLTAYLEGHRSYRYQGSLALHTIMAKGGMNDYMRREPRPLLCEEWIRYRPLYGQPVGSDYSIPMDSDLMPRARDRHAARRAEKGWSL